MNIDRGTVRVWLGVGLSVAIVEKDTKLGGTCLLRGCIPTKAMLHSADLLSEIRHADKHGIRVDGVSIDFPGIMKRKQDIVNKSAAGVSYLMKKNKVEVVRGTGRLTGPGCPAWRSTATASSRPTRCSS